MGVSTSSKPSQEATTGWTQVTRSTIRPSIRELGYEIIAAIGEGGMGEIYKARDTRLDRAIAIKRRPIKSAIYRDWPPSEA
jgi:serine/threonine protein kinase